MEITQRAFLLLLLLVGSVLLSYSGVESRKLSKDEDLEVEKQLKLINKPAVKIIKTINGDTYGCVDFYKQPAFDHPSLKNHTFHFQMRPTSYPKRRSNEQSTTIDKSFGKIWRNGKGCPSGTVPIRRITKDELVRTKLFTKAYASKTNLLAAENSVIHHFALVRTMRNIDKYYNGAGMISSIYNPQVGASQFSANRLTIQRGEDYIQVGWMVNSDLYKDNRTRLFTYTNAGQSHCFNNLCLGIVIVRGDIPLGYAYNNISKPGGPIYDTKFFVYRDSASGNWWLELDRIQIGFWPQQIFTALKDLADFIEWGGHVASPSGVPSPPMGSGHSRIGHTYYDAYCSNIFTIDENGDTDDKVNFSEEFADTKGYQVKDIEYSNKDYRHLVLYGGPGGETS